MSSLINVDIPQNSMVGQQRQQTWVLQFDIPYISHLFMLEDKIRRQMLWIKEVEMVESMEELKSSLSVAGKNFPNFEMLDAKIASVLNKIIQNSHFKKRSL